MMVPVAHRINRLEWRLDWSFILPPSFACAKSAEPSGDRSRSELRGFVRLFLPRTSNCKDHSGWFGPPHTIRLHAYACNGRMPALCSLSMGAYRSVFETRGFSLPSTISQIFII